MNAQGEAARERTDYAARIRRQNERLAFVVAAFLMAISFLPVTRDEDRTGVLLCGAMFFVLTFIWFRFLPARAFGDRRVVVFDLLGQPCIVVLLALTGGLASEYFPFALLLIVATVFSPRVRHTIVVAVATLASLVVVVVVVPPASPAALIADVGTRTLETVGFALIAAMIGRTLRASRTAIAARADELDDLRGRAEALALTDTLTGLYNRRFADDALARLVAEAERGRIFSIAAFDLDGFKRLNDTLGHAAGDAVLVDFARLLREGLRGADVPVRMGGDEFLVLLPGTGLAQTILVVERLRAAARAAGWGAPDAIVTASSGIAQWTQGQSAADMLQAADRSLYIAKRALKAAGDAGPR
jgi:diguanylate cyclase (GGDEF)-like protein